MSLSEKTFIDKIEYITEPDVIQVRNVTIIFREEEEVSRSYNRYTISRGENLEGNDDLVIRIANSIWQ